MIFSRKLLKLCVIGVILFLNPGMSAAAPSVTAGRPNASAPFSKKVTNDSFGSYSLGHNLTSNGRTLRRRQWTLGTLYAAFGLSNQLSVGVSPFVWDAFDMFNLMARYGWDLGSTSRLSWDVAYFKTMGGREIRSEGIYCPTNPSDLSKCRQWRPQYTGFLMEAFSVKATLSERVKDYYRFHSTLSYFYYFDDRLPFSFRMDPANGDRFTFNLTTLHELRLNPFCFFNYELGIWGANYQYPYIHTGLSLNLQKYRWLFGFGVSTTFSPSFPENLKQVFVGYDSRASIHPEFEIQYFFQ